MGSIFHPFTSSPRQNCSPAARLCIISAMSSAEEMADTLRQRRDRYGISYITVTEDGLEPFAPVMERLAR